MAIRGVILDMDGTVTEPYIDFGALRAQIGVPTDSTIVEYIESMPEAEAKRAVELLMEVEREAAEASTLNPGIEELIAGLGERGFATALVTNNHRWAMEHIVEIHGLRFDVLLSRDEGELKPSPDLILKAMAALGLAAEEVIGVGDGRYDIDACAAAGVRFIYLTNGDGRLDHEPAVERIQDVIPLLDTLLAGPLP